MNICNCDCRNLSTALVREYCPQRGRHLCRCAFVTSLALMTFSASRVQGQGTILDVQSIAKVPLRHGYAVDFVKVGDHIYETAAESEFRVNTLKFDRTTQVLNFIGATKGSGLRGDMICYDATRRVLLVSADSTI